MKDQASMWDIIIEEESRRRSEQAGLTMPAANYSELEDLPKQEDREPESQVIIINL